MAGGPGLEIPVSKFEIKLWRSLLSNWCLLAFALIAWLNDFLRCSGIFADSMRGGKSLRLFCFGLTWNVEAKISGVLRFWPSLLHL